MSRAPFDPTLYLVTDPALGRRRPLVETVAAAVQGGVTLVQLRDKAADGRALLEEARALVALLTPLGVPLIVNDRVDVAVAAGAAGGPLGQTDQPTDPHRYIWKPDPASDANVAPLAVRLLRSVAERQRWRAQLLSAIEINHGEEGS